MGQSVREAFGIDVKSLTVDKLREDSCLCEHVYMACLAELSSRGRNDVLVNEADAVFRCGVELFDDMGSTDGLGVDKFFHKVSASKHYSLHKDFYDWICGLLKCMSDYLGFTMPPNYITLRWFFSRVDSLYRAYGGVEWIDGFGHPKGCWKDDKYLDFFHHGIETMCLSIYGVGSVDGRLTQPITGLEWSKLCLGFSQFRQVEILLEYDTDLIEDRDDGEFWCRGVADAQRAFKNVLKLKRKGFVRGVFYFIELFFNCQFIHVGYSTLLDVDLLDTLRELRGEIDSFGLDTESPHLVFVNRYPWVLFHRGSYSEFCDVLRGYDVHVAKMGGDRFYSYDADDLISSTKTQLAVEGSPLGLLTEDALSHFNSLGGVPLRGQRRITMDAFNIFYPNGRKAFIKKSFLGFPFVVCLKGLGVYYVVDDHLIMLDMFLLYIPEQITDPMGDDFIVCDGPVCLDDLKHIKHISDDMRFRVGTAECSIPIDFTCECNSIGGDCPDKRYSFCDLFSLNESEYDECITFKGDLSVFDKYYS